jgi:hypothetical protein
MLTETKTLSLDSTVGGMGDIWMRLTALYSIAALAPDLKIQLRVPGSLLRVARQVWPDRLYITSDELPDAIEITHLGLRHLAPRLIFGRHYLSPFHQILTADRRHPSLKHRLNDMFIRAAQIGGNFHVPTAASVNCYQGYHECSGIGELSEIAYEGFLQQARRDFFLTRARMQSLWAPSSRPAWRLIVLPSGTGHQIMPWDWALANLPDATYVFFERDAYKVEFKERGLRMVEFDSVESLIALASKARFALVTDSFPSHPLQAYAAATVVALSQQPRSRIVHPAFDGPVIDSRAPCCPCANRARGVGRCDAGFDICTTWSKRDYTRDLLAAVL